MVESYSDIRLYYPEMEYNFLKKRYFIKWHPNYLDVNLKIITKNDDEYDLITRLFSVPFYTNVTFSQQLDDDLYINQIYYYATQ